MTAWFAANGIVVASADAQTQRTEVDVGDSTVAAYDGSLGGQQTAVKRAFAITMTPDVQANQAALRNLISGLGDHWSWDDGTAWSDLAQLATLSTNGTQTASVITSGTPKWGAGQLLMPGSTTHGTGNYGSATLPIPYPSNFSTSAWTVTLWRDDGAASAWNHYAFQTGAGGYWKNGTFVSGGVPGWIVVTSPSVLLTGNGWADQHCDDVVVLPYLAPTAWLGATASFYSFNSTTAWPKQRAISASGAFVEGGGPLNVKQTTPPGTTYVQAAVGGSWVTAEVPVFNVQEA